MRSPRVWLVASFGIFCVWHAGDSFLHRELEQPPGVLAPDPPSQTQPPVNPSPVQLGKFTLTPLADYELTARILSRERYRFDAASGLSPVDFALGWGPMSDTSVVQKLDIEQGVRWFWWRSRELPLPVNELMIHAANVHLIPATDTVRSDLLRFRPGQVITLVGTLVSVSGTNGFTWESSLTRTDTGGGSCEVMRVEKAFPRSAPAQR
jgi:hypothetical protein